MAFCKTAGSAFPESKSRSFADGLYRNPCIWGGMCAMAYTSLKFFFFIAVVMLLYFRFPWKQHKWGVLLAASYFFYLLVSYRLVAFLLFTTASTYASALWIEHISVQTKQAIAAHKGEWDRETKKTVKNQANRKKRWILAAVLVGNFGIMVFLKYYNLFAGSLNEILGGAGMSFSVPTLQLILPLGISFYTFQSMGYLIDVYWEKVQAQKNLAKFALFVSFFPQIVQGPISMYDQLAHQLYTPSSFDFTRFKYAAELMLWGTFKKLVIADRAVIALNAATESYGTWNGTTLAFLILLYAIQIYADFSGGIDISRGVAQIFGIDMVDNFRQPYFARSVSEFWQRWHITLGGWFKKYLFYPLAVSSAFSSLGKKIRSSRLGATKAGQHIGKVLPTGLASFIVFLLVGAWHGANWKYLGFGLWFGGIMMISALLAPLYGLALEKFKINGKSLRFRLFQMLRTFALVCLGYIFDVAPNLTQSLSTFWRLLTDHSISTALKQIQELQLEIRHYQIIFLGTVLVFLVDVYHERNGCHILRKNLDDRPFAVRYLLIVGCLLATLYYGVWGPSFGASAFVYMQF